MTEQIESPESEDMYDDDCVMAVNPYCDQMIYGRDCINDAGHDDHCVPRPLNQAEKVDYIYEKFLELETLLEQAGPLLEQAGPLLASFGGQANSPLGRIAGSLFR